MPSIPLTVSSFDDKKSKHSTSVYAHIRRHAFDTRGSSYAAVMHVTVEIDLFLKKKEKIRYLTI